MTRCFLKFFMKCRLYIIYLIKTCDKLFARQNLILIGLGLKKTLDYRPNFRIVYFSDIDMII